MRTFYITKDPTEYLTPGKVGAANRAALKRAARVRAESEHYNEIKIVDFTGRLIEQVATLANTRDRNHVTGYHVRVKPTSPDFRCDHPQHLAWAEKHGEIITATNSHLIVHVPHPHELHALRNDYRFKVENVEVVWTNLP